MEFGVYYLGSASSRPLFKQEHFGNKKKKTPKKIPSWVHAEPSHWLHETFILPKLFVTIFVPELIIMAGAQTLWDIATSVINYSRHSLIALFWLPSRLYIIQRIHLHCSFWLLPSRIYSRTLLQECTSGALLLAVLRAFYRQRMLISFCRVRKLPLFWNTHHHHRCKWGFF
jgi:hypothetical protein